MKVLRYDNEHGSLFELRKDNVIFKIFLGGNGDLYWIIDNLDKDDGLFYQDFLITKENYFIYFLFEQLYMNIVSCKFDEKKVKQNEKYNSLVNDKCITWISDDRDYKYNCAVKISKIDDIFLLEFVKSESMNKNFFWDNSFDISIRFCNSGSYYKPFNQFFMGMYHKLLDYNPMYHQVHIEELEFLKS